jgi:hypothetical protein
MIDPDMDVDRYVGQDDNAFNFFPSAWAFMKENPGTVLAAPACCGEPEFFVNVYARTQQGGLIRIERESAAELRGWQRVGGVGTSTMLIDMSIFDKLSKPYFFDRFSSYEEAGIRYTQDIAFCEKCHEVGVPIWVNFNCWAGHKKTVMIDKPGWVAPKDDTVMAPTHYDAVGKKSVVAGKEANYGTWQSHVAGPKDFEEVVTYSDGKRTMSLTHLPSHATLEKEAPVACDIHSQRHDLIGVMRQHLSTAFGVECEAMDKYGAKVSLGGAFSTCDEHFHRERNVERAMRDIGAKPTDSVTVSYYTIEDRYGGDRDLVDAAKGALGFTDWTISPECWSAITKHLKPGMKTLETGCGLSTKLFIEAGCDHTALEDEEEFLVDGATLCEFDGWYQWKHDGPYDLIFIDGPRGEKGRDGILPHIHPGPPPNLTHSETVIVVDDTHRAPEAGIARSIGEILSGHTLHEYSNEDRSYTVIEPHA